MSNIHWKLYNQWNIKKNFPGWEKMLDALETSRSASLWEYCKFCSPTCREVRHWSLWRSWYARRCKCASGAISSGTCIWLQMCPTNPLHLLAWLFPHNEFHSQILGLLMVHRWSSCLHRSCSSDPLEAWRRSSSQHHLTVQVQIWLVVFKRHSLGTHQSHRACQRSQFSPTFWTPMGVACHAYIAWCYWICPWKESSFHPQSCALRVPPAGFSPWINSAIVWVSRVCPSFPSLTQSSY